jgi:hypothetical protein
MCIEILILQFMHWLRRLLIKGWVVFGWKMLHEAFLVLLLGNNVVHKSCVSDQLICFLMKAKIFLFKKIKINKGM